MPTIALRGIVAFPGEKLHFEIGRGKSINAVKAAMEKDKKIFLVAQRRMSDEDPDFSDLYTIGVTASVEQLVKLQSGGRTVIVLATGLERCVIKEGFYGNDFLRADIEETPAFVPNDTSLTYEKGLVKMLKKAYEEYVGVTGNFSKDALMTVYDIDDIIVLRDFIAANTLDDADLRQEVLEETNAVAGAFKLITTLAKQTDIEAIKIEIDEKVQESIDKSQREYYLHEEMKVISSELQENGEGEESEYREKILSLNLAPEIEEKLLKEAGRLSKMQSTSPDANVVRNYLDVCLGLPWDKTTKENFDIDKARKILDKEHYGLDKVKERFIENLCVHKLGASPNNQIICLIGPPGVGKTSIARSVAKAMNRNFARISLGGVNDEAEIRGHRRTYIGAMPGRIMSAVAQAGSKNALILLDEVDKLGKDYKGDPSSALLEVLDGEQNFSFVDHFIDLPFDLSDILFITTANDASQIPPALYDRMEKIEMESYTFEEKLNIATKHLVKKQLKEHGLNSSQLRINKSAIETIIEKYTREAGVRGLEKNIAAICRKAAVKIVENGEKITVSAKDVEKYLSAPKYIEKAEKSDRVGVVNGLAWTAVGGEMLEVEAAVFDGTGKIEITGNLGDVMKESANLAVSVVRGVGKKYNLDGEFHKNKDIHIHIPQGAVPKDGPSAGITMSTALISALSGKKVRGDVAMTGEISLTGRVMPIGGLKEKSMAAYKNKIKKVIIPEENLSDLNEITETVRNSLEFVPVKNISEVFSLVLI